MNSNSMGGYTIGGYNIGAIGASRSEGTATGPYAVTNGTFYGPVIGGIPQGTIE